MKNLIHYLVISSVILLCSVPFQYTYGKENDGSRYAPNSKLASGKWIKMKVTDNAIYKLTYEEIRQAGIDDPSKVNIFGYGGWILDEDFSNPYVDDLPEVSVWINKGADGVFGSGDYLLFYGRGTVKWSYDNSTQEYVHENNPYSTYGCYFMTQGERGPKEMAEQASASGSQKTLSVFDDYAVHDEDLAQAPGVNSGRELFGESFRSTNKASIKFNFPGITPASGKVSLSFGAVAPNSTLLTLSLDNSGETLINRTIKGGTEAYTKGKLFEYTTTWTGEKTENIAMTVTYPGSGQSFASLNFVRLNVERELKTYDKAYTFFRNKNSQNSVSTYNVKNATDKLLVFDVTGNFDAKLMKTSFSNNELNFVAQSNDTLREFALVDPSKSTGFITPVMMGEVTNQNLHALPQTDMVIIAPTIFVSQARRLAEEHYRRSGLKVLVVEPDSIYNEFSSGSPDATAYRRFMKMFYDRAETENDKPKYLLLFGDGMFDNRFIVVDKSLKKENFLLTYQLKETLDENMSFGTADYFGFLDDNTKGAQGDSGRALASNRLVLGIGCFPVRTQDEARNCVDKVIAYMNNLNRGNWKNTLCFSADDTDSMTSSNFCTHAKQADQLATYVETNHPEYTLSKIYLDSYKQGYINGKKSYPDANNKLNNTFKNGCFLYNYTGHGSTTALSSENLLTMSDVNQMSFTNLPLWITATCDFSWFDGLSQSAGENVFLNKKSGGIALFSTSRVVESGNNLMINDKLIRYLFIKENGKYPRLGDVLSKSKNALPGNTNKLNYVLIGDPALTLNYPESSIELKTINGEPIDANKEYSFKALEQVTITGVVLDPNNNINTGFNGKLHTTGFDAKQTFKATVADTSGKYFTFTDYPNTFFVGNDSVKNGEFTLSFMVPLDISYSDSQGKMSFYASMVGAEEAKGSFLKYKLNGTSDPSEDDKEGPEVLSIYLNSTEFKNGDEVNETPYFFAEVYDPNGINMSGSSIGHDITICIDNSPSWTYNLNQYYEAQSTQFGKGTVKFSIPTLTAGQHTLVFRVWDLLNNPTTDSLTFWVNPALKPQIFDLIATQNPAKLRTAFLLTHDRPETKVDIEVFVYDISGRPVWKYSQNGTTTDWLESYPIEWDLSSGNGMRVNPGVYIYRASIKTANSQETTKAKKIIVLGQ